MIPAYSPEARGRSERMFGTLQKRLPQADLALLISSLMFSRAVVTETFSILRTSSMRLRR